MKIASWNVNSLNVRLPHLTQWLGTFAPDIVGLQETKLEDHRFPVMAPVGGCVAPGHVRRHPAWCGTACKAVAMAL